MFYSIMALISSDILFIKMAVSEGWFEKQSIL